MKMYKETAVRIVPKEHHQILKDDNGFVRRIVHDISEDLAERVLYILNEERDIVVRQFDLRVEEQKMLHQVEYRQNIMWTPLVRCKDCKWYQDGELFPPKKFCFRLKDKDGKRVGYNFAYEDFCSYGERKDDADNETV